MITFLNFIQSDAEKSIIDHEAHLRDNEDDSGLECKLTNYKDLEQHSSIVKETQSHNVPDLTDAEVSEYSSDVKTADWVAVMYEDNWYPGALWKCLVKFLF